MKPNNPTTQFHGTWAEPTYQPDLFKPVSTVKPSSTAGETVTSAVPNGWGPTRQRPARHRASTAARTNFPGFSPGPGGSQREPRRLAPVTVHTPPLPAINCLSLAPLARSAHSLSKAAASRSHALHHATSLHPSLYTHSCCFPSIRPPVRSPRLKTLAPGGSRGASAVPATRLV